MNRFISIEKKTKKVSIQKIAFSILLFFVSLSAFSQATYPVQVYTQLTPPYTPYVPSYYTGTQEKLSVTLINTDLRQPVLNVYLRMKITSSSFSLITPNEIFTPQIELQAGMPLKLSLNDLAVYFKKENVRVSGGQNEFYRTQLLPDNFYRFNFEVYEVNTNKLLSNPKMGFAQTMIASGEPPTLTMPKKGDIIVEKDIPNIFFSWIPRHMNSIAAAYGTEYEFTMVEIYDKRVAPEAAFDYSRVLYTETTKSTSFIHTSAQPMLQPGLRYAWRVRVVAREGVDEISIFKNGGYSPVFWFDYTMDCQPVYSTGAIYERDHINITWIETEASDYVVEYRKKGSSKWYTGNITGNHCPVYNLKLGGEYEYRVGSRCLMNDPYQYSEIKGFRLPAQEERSPNCGLMPDTKISNQTPTRELQAGLPVLVGDFPVFITKVSGSGRFSGEGYVGIPYLQGAQIAVTFKDIVVNTDNQLVSGFFETKYDIKNNNMLVDLDQTLTGGKGVGDIRTGEEKAAFKVDYTINPAIKAKIKTVDNSEDDITEGGEYNTSKGENEEHKGHVVIELTDDKGNKQEIKTDKIPTTIEDASGKIYEVDKDGNISLVSQNSDIKIDDKTKNKQRSDIATLSFRESSNSKYALDEYKDIYAKVTEYYEKYKIEGTNIEASAKFILPGASDEVEVYIKDSKKEFIADSVRFVTATGKEYTPKYNKNSETWTLTVVGSEANDGQEVFAVQRLKDGSIATLGKLNIFSYEPLERTVYLVSVNGATNNLTEQSVREGLNKIYGKIGITWDVQFLESGFEYTPINGSTFNVTGSGLFSTLTNDMKAINEAFKTSDNYQEGGLYLFVLPYEPSDKGESINAGGDMPLGSQFGYLFPDADAHTIAHEVGHGAFNLEHPFSRPGRNSFSKGDLKNNLMDYSSETEFAKIQWDATRAPGLVIGLFQKDKDGMGPGGMIEIAGTLDPNGKQAEFKLINEDCYKFQLKSGKLVWFTDYEIIQKIKTVHFSEDGKYLQAIESIDGDTYEISYRANVQDNSSDKVKITKTFYTDRFVAFEKLGLLSKEKLAAEGISTKESTDGRIIYQGIKNTSEYVLVRFIKNIKDAEAGDNVLRLDNDKNLVCDTLSESDASRATLNNGSKYFKATTYSPFLISKSGTIDDFGNEIKDAVSKLNTLVQSNSGRESFGDYLASGPNYYFIHKDNDVPADEEFLNRLDDRLKYLSEYSSSRKNKVEIYVIYQKIDKVLGNNWNEYAEQVYLKSELNGKKAVLITVPYFKHTATTPGSNFDDFHHSTILTMPGLYVAAPVATDMIGEIAQTGTGKNISGFLHDYYYYNITLKEVETFVRNVYKQTAKPTKIHYGFLFPDESITSSITELDEYISGLDFCKGIVLLKNEDGFEKIRNLKEPSKYTDEVLTVNVKTGNIVYKLNDNYYEELREYQRAYDKICSEANINKADQWEAVNNSILFKEKYIDKYATDYIATFAFEGSVSQYFKKVSMVWDDVDIDKGYKADLHMDNLGHAYDLDRLTVIDPLVYGVADLTSLGLSFVGLDFIPEGVALTYAVVRGQPYEISSYTAGIVLIGVSGGAIRIAGKIDGAVDFIRMGGKFYKIGKDGKRGAEITEEILRLSIQREALNLPNATKTQLDDIIKALDNGKISKAQLDNILKESTEVKRLESFTSAIKGGDELLSSGRFVDNSLEEAYEKYIQRKLKEGKSPKDRLEWKEARDYWLNDSPMARGNDFNSKAVREDWYPYNEVHLENGKRLDAYNEELGEIVSRKATDLEDIQLDTFEGYLKEMKQKYAPGTGINSPKYGDDLKDKILQGKQILEIPESNRTFGRIQEYIDLAKNKYNIEIRFRPE